MQFKGWILRGLKVAAGCCEEGKGPANGQGSKTAKRSLLPVYPII